MTSVSTGAVLWDDDRVDDAVKRPPLDHATLLDGADVVIVGAGFTGLWTAYHLLVDDPTRRVLVLEADRVGFGASGRNGGWCTPEIPLSLDTVDRRHGPGTARRWRHGLVEAVTNIREVCTREGIDAQWSMGGWLQFARHPAQEQRVRHLVAEFRRHGFGDDAMRFMDPDEVATRTRVTRLRGASFSAQTAAFHPGRLVRGLAAAVQRRGGVIAEGVRVQSLVPHGVITSGGRISAPWVVRATEAYTARLPRHRRVLVPVYSMMIATEPLPPQRWEEIGLADREVFNDARRGVIYGQRTADGRFAFGGRGAPYHYASNISPRFDAHRATRNRLASTLAELYPAAADVAVTHHWGGPLGIARDWHPSVGLDPQRGWAWAGGYVGEGVAASALAGRTLADLIGNRSSVRSDLAWVGHASRRWEPEPLRWLGINAMVRLAQFVDRREEAGSEAPRVAGRLLERLLGH